MLTASVLKQEPNRFFLVLINSLMVDSARVLRALFCFRFVSNPKKVQKNADFQTLQHQQPQMDKLIIFTFRHLPTGCCLVTGISTGFVLAYKNQCSF